MLLGPLLGIKEDSLICTLCTSSHQSSSKAQAPVFRSPDLISFAWKSYGIIFLNYIWISHWDKWIWDILNFRICLLRTRWGEGLCRLSWPLHFHLSSVLGSLATRVWQWWGWKICGKTWDPKWSKHYLSIFFHIQYWILFRGLNMLLICSNVSNILQYLLIFAPSQRVYTFLNSQQSAFSFTKFDKAMRKKCCFSQAKSMRTLRLQTLAVAPTSRFLLQLDLTRSNLKNKVKMGRKLSRYVKNCQDKIVMISLMILYNIFLYGREILPWAMDTLNIFFAGLSKNKQVSQHLVWPWKA